MENRLCNWQSIAIGKYYNIRKDSFWNKILVEFNQFFLKTLYLWLWKLRLQRFIQSGTVVKYTKENVISLSII